MNEYIAVLLHDNSFPGHYTASSSAPHSIPLPQNHFSLLALPMVKV